MVFRESSLERIFTWRNGRVDGRRARSLTGWVRWRAALGLLGAVVVAAAVAPAWGQEAASAPPAAASATVPAASGAPVLRWRPVTRDRGRLRAAQLGLVINTADPYSVEVGDYYARQRGIPAVHILRIELPVQTHLGADDLARLKREIDDRFDDGVQALALAWVQPYAVSCQSITAVLALGVDPSLCSRTCDRASTSPYFNSPSREPFKDHGLRPSMLIAARSVAQAKALIDRGVASDHSLGLRGSIPVNAWYAVTTDRARSVRWPLFPPPGTVPGKGVEVHVAQTNELKDKERVLLVQTGLPQLSGLDSIGWVPGALADHLTSFGGLLDRLDGQTNALAWIEAGATASYGTVSEPCNHLQKFPHPQLLLLHYLQGSTALEAYWKSVAWPQQGVFVGEPLAAPFARQ